MYFGVKISFFLQALLNLLVTQAFATIPTDWIQANLTVGTQILASEYLNSNFPSLAFDNDVTTCYKSGSGQDHWWKIKTDNPVAVKGVVLNGFWPGQLQVRVGNNHDSLGDMSGHGTNRPCCMYELEGKVEGLVMPCSVMMTGTVLSLGAQSELTSLSDTMGAFEICDLKVYI